MLKCTLLAAGLSAITLSSSNTADDPDWSSVAACARIQADCIEGGCDVQSLERSCYYGALSNTAEAIVRSETRFLASRAQTHEEPSVCTQAINEEIRRGFESIRSDGPLAIREPYAPTPGTDELSGMLERELYWRAQLDERLTGFAAQRSQSGTGLPCELPAFADVGMLRAQNFAFAESVDALSLARDGHLSPPALWGTWFIYHHADLWQDEQAAASQVFSALAEEGDFPGSLARNTANRVAAHQPLYTPEQLEGGWPE